MLLSACLLSYNSVDTLEKTILSVLKQDFTDYELIISDDCSIDNSWDLINSYSKLYDKIIPLRTPRNLGMAGNANFAAEKVTGKYITILHHDDEYSPVLFRKWVTVMEAHLDVGLCFNDYSARELNVKSVHKEQLKRHYRGIIDGKKFLKSDLLKHWGCSVWGTYITRKEIWNELNGFNSKYDLLADVDLTMRIASKFDIGYINEPLIDLKRSKPIDYPKDYTGFSWNRIFLLFDIHSNSINQENYPQYFHYVYQRFLFRNKVSFEIIKWHLYALYKNKREIIKSYPRNGNQLELFYVKFIRSTIRFIFS